MRDQAAIELRALYEVIERLRAPGGCPWDAAQTHRTLRPYLLEETYEALEAIESGDLGHLCEELGDVLLQVCMQSAIAAESGDAGFDIGDVAAGVRAKMVRRHPHVFADAQVSGADDVLVKWERIKAAEKSDRLSVLDGVPRSLPALAYALGLQKRPARLGFDQTPSLTDALDALRRALSEVVAEAAKAPRQEPPSVTSPRGHDPGPPPAPVALEDAVGDLLLAAVAVARRLRVNPEDALRRRADADANRFRAMEAAARADNVDVHDIDAAEWGRRWAETAG